MMRSAIVDHVIDAAALLAEVADEGSGASIVFVGTVRNSNDGRAVTGIEYAAYRSMAERELAAIVSETSLEFGTTSVVVEHRVGTLGLGEASVAIAVAHAHRGAAYDASRFVIEEIKKRLPIWKREHYADGMREWVDPTAAHAGAGR